jgi:hypothetical protein
MGRSIAVADPAGDHKLNSLVEAEIETGADRVLCFIARSLPDPKRRVSLQRLPDPYTSHRPTATQ